jgi:diguanylate cyclase (GGDEF)-like protein
MSSPEYEIERPIVVAQDTLSAHLAFAVLYALEQPVLVCDLVGRLALANAAARDLLGLTEELDTDGLGWVEEDEAHPPAPVLLPLWRALEGVQLRRKRLRLLTRTGESELLEVSASALWDARGELLGATLTIFPARPDAASEERLRNYAADMEGLEEVSRVLAELQDPDEAASVICTVATGATGAIAVLLWEHAGEDLVVRCYEGGVSADELADISEQARDGAARAVSESKTVVEGPDDRALAGGAIAAGGPQVPLGTAWHQPLTRGGVAMGVLSILWTGLLDDLERPGLLIRSLADHAATALERAALLRRLNDAARTDPLTGLANRRVWEETLEQELLRALRDDRPLSLVLIDIDHFKAYNDTYGHPEGDQLLQRAASAWSHQLRATDLIARVGGEEFAVLLPGCAQDRAPLVAERLRAAMPAGQTCSLGTVTCDQIASAADLYAAADGALYRAKRSGRNRVEAADPPEN